MCCTESHLTSIRRSTDDGLAKMCNTAWVKDILAKVDSPQTDDENLREQEGENFIDLDHDISDVL